MQFTQQRFDYIWLLFSFPYTIYLITLNILCPTLLKFATTRYEFITGGPKAKLAMFYKALNERIRRICLLSENMKFRIL